MESIVTILQNGYCIPEPDGKQFKADCTISLIKSQECGYILVDTGGPWNKDKLVDNLYAHDVNISDISVVVCTHGHSDHVGNLNLFSDSTKLIVGHDISVGCIYESFDFSESNAYKLSSDIEVISTPGHTHSDVSVVVKNTDLGTIVIAGDLFECSEDRDDDTLWKANSEDPNLQLKSRDLVCTFADYIVPGHGPMFANGKANQT